MKKKSKLDTKAIKQFFIDHTEKIAIGAVGLLFLYFTYSAVTMQVNDSYKKEPKNLTDAVQAATRTMVAGPSTKTPAIETPINAYAKDIERFKEPEDPKKHGFVERILPGVIAQQNPRGTPKVIPVEELRAVAGRGAFGGESSNSAVGQRWVLVTGLVPYAKQLAEFKDKFDGTSFQGEHDTPEYAGFLVQRAEVTSGATGEPNWDKAVTFCSQKYLDAQISKWTGTTQEIVEARFVYGGLTSPLPPRAIGEWGDEAAHPEAIKVLPPEEKDQVLGGGQVQGAAGTRPGGRGQQPMMPPRTGGRGSRYGGGERRGAITPEGGRGGAPRGDQGGDDIFGGKPEAAKEEAVSKPADEAPYFLLRYYDFDVEPGKQYVYRVYLLLRNPNDGVPENVLSEPLQASQHLVAFVPGMSRPDANNKLKLSDLKVEPSYWSNSCQSSRLPGNLHLIAGPVEPPKSPSPTEIIGEVRFLGWDDTTGATRNTRKEGIYRGTVLNFDDVAWRIPGDPTPVHDKLESNNVLVDITGGDALTARDRDKIHCPGAMLYLDEMGNLVIADEMAQAKEWAKDTKEPERATPAFNRGGGVSPERGGRMPRGRGERGGVTPRGPSDSALPDMPRGR
jgi:hypothetical protein